MTKNLCMCVLLVLGVILFLMELLALFLYALVLVWAFVFVWVVLGSLLFRVPFIRTKVRTAEGMVELAGIKKGERVYELGAGDGRISFLAAGKGGICVGVEGLLPLVWMGRLRGVFQKNSVEFRCEDFFDTDLSDADVVFCYLSGDIMDRFFREKFSSLKKGCRVVSNSFLMREVKEDKKVKVGGKWVYVYVR